MAAALLRDAAEMDPALGAPCLEVRSAGISATDGEPATQLAIEAMKPYGIDLEAHRATRLSPDLVKWADLILTMTRGHRDHLVGHFAGAGSKTFTLAGYGGAGADVDDPLVVGTEDAYGKCANQLRSYVPGILNRLQAANQPPGV
jgi:protein-tyrosine phosphatase